MWVIEDYDSLAVSHVKLKIITNLGGKEEKMTILVKLQNNPPKTGNFTFCEYVNHVKMGQKQLNWLIINLRQELVTMVTSATADAIGENSKIIFGKVGRAKRRSWQLFISKGL